VLDGPTIKQRSFGSVHEFAGIWQHGWPVAPQRHVPATQVPKAPLFGCRQLAPEATQVPGETGSNAPEQQALASLHLAFGQQGFPVRPQGRQIGGDGV
jgi:hypothetical protein